MQLVEQQIIKPNNPIFAEIDAAAFASKNLYNAVNYVMRQAFFATGRTPSYPALAKQLKDHEAYTALPRKVSQWTLKTLEKSWQAYFAGHRE